MDPLLRGIEPAQIARVAATPMKTACDARGAILQAMRNIPVLS